jgi:hypothetical protein
VELEQPAWAPAPGQAAVFYDEAGAVLGGGRIATSPPGSGLAEALGEAELAEPFDATRLALVTPEPGDPGPRAIGAARA